MPAKNGSIFLKGLGWKYSIYHHHPRDHNTYSAYDYESGTMIDWYYDFAFHSYDNYPGSDRPLRILARNLHNPEGSIQVGGSSTKLWIPLQNTDLTVYKLSWCGWETGQGQKWGALWRYKTNDELYYKPASANCNFVIDGNYAGWSVQLWKFDSFNSQSCQFNYQNTTIQITAGDYNSSTGKTTISVSGVTENPTFLKFSH